MSAYHEDVCWTSHELTRGPVRGLMVHFHGLNNPGEFGSASTTELAWAEAGVLVAKPSCGPWSFMNAGTVRFVDELIPELRAVHGLDEALPLFIAGDSMGGCAALTYTALGAHRPAACIALEPVADLVDQAGRSPRSRRIYEVAFGYDDWERTVAERSPHRLLDRYPDVPYLIAHGPQDPLIDAARSAALAAAMRDRGLTVEYHDFPHYGHQHAQPLALVRRLVSFVEERLPPQTARS